MTTKYVIKKNNRLCESNVQNKWELRRMRKRRWR